MQSPSVASMTRLVDVFVSETHVTVSVLYVPCICTTVAGVCVCEVARMGTDIALG